MFKPIKDCGHWSEDRGHWSDIFDPSQRIPYGPRYVDEVTKTIDATKRNTHDMQQPMRDEKERSMLVIVKRGEGVDYVGTSTTISTEQNIWGDTGVNTWGDIKASYIDAEPDDSEQDNSDYDEDQYFYEEAEDDEGEEDEEKE
jgi:hypothetical protein